VSVYGENLMAADTGLSCPDPVSARMSVVTTEDDLLAVARRELGPSSRWTLTLQRDARGFVLVADHPASAGLMIETGTLDHDLAARRISSWMGQREVAVADAAPELVHPDTAAGVRALAVAFDWPTVQVRAVAFLLFEAGVLTADEAAWLSGFVAHDAPMVVTPPI
jgi:hypothetical protein